MASLQSAFYRGGKIARAGRPRFSDGDRQRPRKPGPLTKPPNYPILPYPDGRSPLPPRRDGEESFFHQEVPAR